MKFKVGDKVRPNKHCPWDDMIGCVGKVFLTSAGGHFHVWFDYEDGASGSVWLPGEALDYVLNGIERAVGKLK